MKQKPETLLNGCPETSRVFFIKLHLRVCRSQICLTLVLVVLGAVYWFCEFKIPELAHWQKMKIAGMDFRHCKFDFLTFQWLNSVRQIQQRLECFICADIQHVDVQHPDFVQCVSPNFLGVWFSKKFCLGRQDWEKSVKIQNCCWRFEGQWKSRLVQAKWVWSANSVNVWSRSLGVHALWLYSALIDWQKSWKSYGNSLIASYFSCAIALTRSRYDGSLFTDLFWAIDWVALHSRSGWLL